MAPDPKPVLWVALTSYGRDTMDEEAMGALEDRLEEQLGDDYEIVVADDKTRLLGEDDVRDLLAELAAPENET